MSSGALRTASVSVDIDGLHLYHRIHGLPDPPSDGPTVYETGVRRFLELFDRHGVRGTFFVVGEDVADPRARAVLQQAVDAGHELASHSFTHPYALSRLGQDAIERELEHAEDAIVPLLGGQRPAGFRAPGYNTSPALLGALRSRGYAYDSSYFPCPPYYLAKAAVIGAYRLLGRRSHSIVGDPRVMWSPRGPFRHGEGEARGLLELPMTVVPGARFPIIGTSLILLGRKGWSVARRTLSGVPFLNVEFHAIDLTDHAGDGIDDALLAQPDQRVPLEQKLAVFDDVLRDLKAAWEVTPLQDAARAWSRALPG